MEKKKKKKASRCRWPEHTLNSKPILSANKDSLLVGVIVPFPTLAWSVWYADGSSLSVTREAVLCRGTFGTKIWVQASTSPTEICGNCRTNNEVLKYCDIGSETPLDHPVKWGCQRIRENTKLERIPTGPLLQPCFHGFSCNCWCWH